MLATIILYILTMFVCVGLIHWSMRNHTNIGVYAAYFILILLSVLRFDIGWDYENYTVLINHLSLYFKQGIPISHFYSDTAEPMMYLLSFIFQDAMRPYIWVIAVYAIVTIGFLYKAFKENNSHALGIILFFISGMMFFSWDVLRQGVSVAIFIYATKFIKNRNFPKYLFYVLLASTFHYSALLLLPFYFVNRFKLKKSIYIIVILGLIIFNTSNLNVKLYELVTSYIPFYSVYGPAHSFVLQEFLSVKYKIRIIFYCLIWLTTILSLSDEENVLSNLLFIGAILFVIASGSIQINRFAAYFIYTETISIPKIKYNRNLKNPNLVKSLVRLLIFGLFLFYVYDMTSAHTRGCVPYDSIFSNNFALQHFRLR